MKAALHFFDQLAGAETATPYLRAIERVAFLFLVLMVLAAPVSIAATQTAWLIGMLAWVVRLCFKPRPKITVGAVGFALIALFAWTAFSSAFSYEPATSLGKLRGASIFLIFFFVAGVVRNIRAIHFLAFCLIASCSVSAIWAPVHKLIGRGVEVRGVMPGGPLAKAGVIDGDTFTRANGKKITTPRELLAAIETSGTAELEMFRGVDARYLIQMRAADLLGGETEGERLGFASWGRSGSFRAAGFYGHYATFAEVLMLIASLVFGLLIAAYVAKQSLKAMAPIFTSVVFMAFALLLTITRASQLAFVISSLAVVLLGARRRLLIAAVAVAVPAALIGLYVLQQQRQVGFFDAKDGSIQYRQMMMRDGIRLWTESPRHFVVGVGMDSIKDHWQDWELYDKGWQPMGHFHSTPLQLVVERGLPALLIWLIVLGVYVRSIWRGIQSPDIYDWRSRGTLLGCLGGAVGFFASGLVHYNLGDAEVAMVFYILMGLSVKLIGLSQEDVILRDSPILQSAEGRG